MSTLVSEGNRVTNCQFLILKISMAYLPINVFINFSHDIFFITERKKTNKMKTIFSANETVSFHYIAFKPSVVVKYCYIGGLARVVVDCCYIQFI